MLGPHEIQKRFGLWPITVDVAEKKTSIREAYLEFAKALDEMLPSTRQTALAFTDLEASMMWAMKAADQEAITRFARGEDQ